MSKPFYNLASGTIGVALAVSFVLPAAADADRRWWLQTLQEQRAGATVEATPVTATAPGVTSSTAQRDPRDAAVMSAAVATPTPQYRMISGRLVPVNGTVTAVRQAPPPVQAAPALRTAAVTPQMTRPISRQIDPAFLPTEVSFSGYKPGTIVIDTEEKYLYLQMDGGMAKRYGVGVGRPGFQWAGTHKITMKREWPGWTPPAQMRKRQPELPAFMEGGPENPLGARAMYLGSTLYRIHGSNAPWTIGHEVSSGCIRMRNEDVMDLYDRVGVGTTVVVKR
ncbi:L,D-transpeptidase [Acuticoccus yangtzensis]|uniref:L,D-transpeptidase n=1 Tax=Acuticoccus yangtzensis TaxID=1443441 RepID=UPI0009F7AE2F|nr:L,D-transpeptidase [Acuticoccus yangtzensis]ORE92016.1 ErfK/YbiS/YcfS/YnhG family protein [Stappia sp. 22II-S9-Z10]